MTARQHLVLDIAAGALGLVLGFLAVWALPDVLRLLGFVKR